MKTISLSIIGVGILCTLVAFVETLVSYYIMQVHPMSLIVLSSTLFLMAIALMCHTRFYCTKPEQKAEQKAE